jgi:phage-related holin
MVLAFGLDAVILDQHIFTSLMIAFIVINDAISILENLNEL